MSKKHEFSPTKAAIIQLIEAWGKRTIYRYLRDHNMLDDFIEQLPLKDYVKTDEVTIQKKLMSIWDDFSDAKLDEMRKWQLRALESGLGMRVAQLGAQLYHEGHRSAAIEVLRLAQEVDNVQRHEYVIKKASDLSVDDIVVAVEDEIQGAPGHYAMKLGFGDHHHSGRVTKIARLDDKVVVSVFVPQMNDSFKLDLLAATPVKIMQLVRPYYSRAMKEAALAKIIKAESATRDPQIQARIARVRFSLEQDLRQEAES